MYEMYFSVRGFIDNDISIVMNKELLALALQFEKD